MKILSLRDKEVLKQLKKILFDHESCALPLMPGLTGAGITPLTTRSIHKFFTCCACVSLHRCSGAALKLFHALWFDNFPLCFARKTGRLVYPGVQGNSFFECQGSGKLRIAWLWHNWSCTQWKHPVSPRSIGWPQELRRLWQFIWKLFITDAERRRVSRNSRWCTWTKNGWLYNGE